MRQACFEHSNFFKVKAPNPHLRSVKRKVSLRNGEEAPYQHPPLRAGWQLALLRNPTTSFLTAATLVYAIRAGITAAAGTRLAL